MYRENSIYDDSGAMIKQIYPLFLAERYFALDLEDMIDNKKKIKVTTALFPSGVFSAGFSLINLPWIEVEQINNYHSYVYDSSGCAIVNNHNPFDMCQNRKNMPFGKIFNPIFSYSKTHDHLWLIDYNCERETICDSLLNMRYNLSNFFKFGKFSDNYR
jgi:hypothetical protein